MSYKKIQKEADALLDKYACGHFPVPVIEIANHIGIQVFADDDYCSNRSGHVEINDSDELSIIVNSKETPARKTFTIAHEIGHTVFDMDYLKEHRCADRDGNAADATYRTRESRANRFAACLLMPEDAFIEQWIALGDIRKVADYFGVSRDAAKFRALNIGLMS